MKPSEKHADSAFYGIVAKEIQAGNVDVGLMAKAVHQAKGNKKDAELLYLGWRVELLKEEAVEDLKIKEEEAAIQEMHLKAEKAKREEAERERFRKEHGSYGHPTGMSDEKALKFGLIGIGVIILFIIILAIETSR